MIHPVHAKGQQCPCNVHVTIACWRTRVKLRVHGLEGLRVIDASIMPTLISGNTQAPSIMVGKQAPRS
jgi:hypothetical protein